MGQRTWAALAATATYLQSGELVRYPGRVPAPVGGRDFLGADPLDRYYPVSDGWLRVQALCREPVPAEALRNAGIMVDPERYQADRAAALGAALAGLSAAEAVDRLAGADIAAYPARKVTEVVRDPQLVSSEFVHVRTASDGSVFVTTGRYATFSRTPRFGPMISPGAGEHTAQVLAGAGLTEPEIADLARARAVEPGNPMEQRLPLAYR